jgi:hypothetical protein
MAQLLSAMGCLTRVPGERESGSPLLLNTNQLSLSWIAKKGNVHQRLIFTVSVIRNENTRTPSDQVCHTELL